MKKWLAVCVCLAVVVFAVLLYKNGGTQEKKDASPGVQVGDKAEDFTLKNLNDGRISLRDYIGKNVILLVFSTTWCPSCNKEIPELKKLDRDYQDKGLKIINVFIQEGKPKVGGVVSKNKIPYEVLLDIKGSVARKYRVRGVPTLMIIDTAGIIRKRGYPPSSQHISLIEDLLGELKERNRKEELKGR